MVICHRSSVEDNQQGAKFGAEFTVSCQNCGLFWTSAKSTYIKTLYYETAHLPNWGLHLVVAHYNDRGNASSTGRPLGLARNIPA